MAENKEWYMGNDFIEQANDNHEWQDIFIATIDKAMEKTNVGTLAFVVEVDNDYPNYSIAKVKPFPLEKGQEEYILEVYAQKESVEVDDVVVVLFLDRNFKGNLAYDEPKVANTEILHNISQGVIISTLIKKNN